MAMRKKRGLTSLKTTEEAAEGGGGRKAGK